MLVDLRDGQCRSCHGQLEIQEVDDATMAVMCTECDDNYLVEPDAFGDGCLTYYVPMQCLQEGLDPDDIHL